MLLALCEPLSITKSGTDPFIASNDIQSCEQNVMGIGYPYVALQNVTAQVLQILTYKNLTVWSRAGYHAARWRQGSSAIP